MTIQGEETVQRHNLLVRCKEAYDLIQSYLNDSLPWGFVPERRIGYKYDPNLRNSVKQKLLKSMNVLNTAIENHGLEEIAISYNGGKDCLVMLIIVLATIHKRFVLGGNVCELPVDYKLDSIYINSELPFPELSTFIEKSTSYYFLNPVIIKSSLKEGFEKYLNEINPCIKSIIVGIRYSDPYGSDLKYEQITDHHWPKFLRIHPILHWNYIDIWDFLIGCNLDYCRVYDLGYTSLGGIENTSPNPYLRIADKDEYLPAYMLSDDADSKERIGRNRQ